MSPRCTALHRTALHGTARHYTALHTASHSPTPHHTVPHRTASHRTKLPKLSRTAIHDQPVVKQKQKLRSQVTTLSLSAATTSNRTKWTPNERASFIGKTEQTKLDTTANEMPQTKSRGRCLTHHIPPGAQHVFHVTRQKTKLNYFGYEDESFWPKKRRGRRQTEPQQHHARLTDRPASTAS